MLYNNNNDFNDINLLYIRFLFVLNKRTNDRTDEDKKLLRCYYNTYNKYRHSQINIKKYNLDCGSIHSSKLYLFNRSVVIPV